MEPHLAIPVGDASQVGEARRRATGLAQGLGLSQADAGRVALVVTEVATNIVKHAQRGTLLLRALREETDRPGVEVLGLDRGPGMADVARCLQDGYSTAGSPGTGLGAISRQATSLEIYSAPGLGTGLLARVLPKGAQVLPAQGPLAVGAVRVAAPGESECGDAWAMVQDRGRAVLMVADGLGHGANAAKASAAAVSAFQQCSHLSPTEILDWIHRALLATRGAAVSVAEVDLAASEVRFAGVGNVAGILAWPGGGKSMVTQNGTLGAQTGRLRAFSYPWTRGGALVVYTDGLTSHVSLHGLPGLLARDPSLVAGVLYRDFVRGRDDATVVVALEREGRP